MLSTAQRPDWSRLIPDVDVLDADDELVADGDTENDEEEMETNAVSPVAADTAVSPVAADTTGTEAAVTETSVTDAIGTNIVFSSTPDVVVTNTTDDVTVDTATEGGSTDAAGVYAPSGGDEPYINACF